MNHRLARSCRGRSHRREGSISVCLSSSLFGFVCDIVFRWMCFALPFLSPVVSWLYALYFYILVYLLSNIAPAVANQWRV